MIPLDQGDWGVCGFRVWEQNSPETRQACHQEYRVRETR
jgi:hypothetical protein